ncbi:hypothetical protein NEAUS04_0528 [Nematocida ausubeli]|nr:hypothetical protein NEAUS04_0528 [Nematocida ausubeli]
MLSDEYLEKIEITLSNPFTVQMSQETFCRLRGLAEKQARHYPQDRLYKILGLICSRLNRQTLRIAGREDEKECIFEIYENQQISVCGIEMGLPLGLKVLAYGIKRGLSVDRDILLKIAHLETKSFLAQKALVSISKAVVQRGLDYDGLFYNRIIEMLGESNSDVKIKAIQAALKIREKSNLIENTIDALLRDSEKTVPNPIWAPAMLALLGVHIYREKEGEKSRNVKIALRIVKNYMVKISNEKVMNGLMVILWGMTQVGVKAHLPFLILLSIFSRSSDIRKTASGLLVEYLGHNPCDQSLRIIDTIRSRQPDIKALLKFGRISRSLLAEFSVVLVSEGVPLLIKRAAQLKVYAQQECTWDAADLFSKVCALRVCLIQHRREEKRKRSEDVEEVKMSDIAKDTEMQKESKNTEEIIQSQNIPSREICLSDKEIDGIYSSVSEINNLSVRKTLAEISEKDSSTELNGQLERQKSAELLDTLARIVQDISPKILSPLVKIEAEALRLQIKAIRILGLAAPHAEAAIMHCMAKNIFTKEVLQVLLLHAHSINEQIALRLGRAVKTQTTVLALIIIKHPLLQTIQNEECPRMSILKSSPGYASYIYLLAIKRLVPVERAKSILFSLLDCYTTDPLLGDIGSHCRLDALCILARAAWPSRPYKYPYSIRQGTQPVPISFVLSRLKLPEIDFSFTEAERALLVRYTLKLAADKSRRISHIVFTCILPSVKRVQPHSFLSHILAVYQKSTKTSPLEDAAVAAATSTGLSLLRISMQKGQETSCATDRQSARKALKMLLSGLLNALVSADGRLFQKILLHGKKLFRRKKIQKIVKSLLEKISESANKQAAWKINEISKEILI